MTLPDESSDFVAPCMKHELAREVIACLPHGRTLFHYSKDDYAFLLLNLLGRQERTIQEIRRSKLGRLLEKPSVKPFLAHCSNGRLTPGDLPARQYHPGGEAYRLSLDIWGENLESWRFNQVSRKGVSLVLQLNMPQSHFRRFQKCLVHEDDNPFHYPCHPARNGRNPTLAWCRLDLDLDAREALIEEIQTDYLRDYREAMHLAYRARRENQAEFNWYGYEFKTNRLIDYWERCFRVHEKTWHEAMLTAALEFLFEEVGVNSLYYHTPESGKFLKRISGTEPPVSLYTSLPKRFCFEPTTEPPYLLKNARCWQRRVRSVRQPLEFFRLAI